MFTIFVALSQFGRDLVSQRTKEGLKTAKVRGRNDGRPSKKADKAFVVGALYKQGIKIVEIVKQTGLSRSTACRIVREID